MAALTAGLLPIVCVGERLEEREAGRTGDVIATQFAGSLAGLSGEQMAEVTIAYEPVWAIGTGRTATPEQAEEVHLDLRKLIASRYNAQLAEAVRIQYGGSVNAKNAAELLAQPNIDGALVGGASLKADDFLAIIAAGANRQRRVPRSTFGRCRLRLNEVVMQVLFMFLLFIVAVFMILLVLSSGAVGAGSSGLSAAWAAKARSAPKPAICLRESRCGAPRLDHFVRCRDQVPQRRCLGRWWCQAKRRPPAAAGQGAAIGGATAMRNQPTRSRRIQNSADPQPGTKARRIQHKGRASSSGETKPAPSEAAGEPETKPVGRRSVKPCHFFLTP